MLKKLIKYDFKALIRYWWIAALSSLGLAFLGGWSISVFANEKELPEVLYVVATLAATVAIIGAIAFSILTIILVYSRFYKNFFTDEGYLTFTLPVKRSQLLNSKLITSSILSLMTGFVIIVDIVVALCVGVPEVFFVKEFWQEFWDEFLLEIIRETGAYSVVYFIEVLAFILIYSVFSTLFVYCCITIASIITKKAKVITAIGIYYGANSIFTFTLQMFGIFGISALSEWLDDIPADSELPVFALLLLIAVLFMAIICGVLYSIQYWMLDKKLNLS